MPDHGGAKSRPRLAWRYWPRWLDHSMDMRWKFQSEATSGLDFSVPARNQHRRRYPDRSGLRESRYRPDGPGRGAADMLARCLAKQTPQRLVGTFPCRTASSRRPEQVPLHNESSTTCPFGRRLLTLRQTRYPVEDPCGSCLDRYRYRNAMSCRRTLPHADPKINFRRRHCGRSTVMNWLPMEVHGRRVRPDHHLIQQSACRVRSLTSAVVAAPMTGTMAIRRYANLKSAGRWSRGRSTRRQDGVVRPRQRGAPMSGPKSVRTAVSSTGCTRSAIPRRMPSVRNIQVRARRSRRGLVYGYIAARDAARVNLTFDSIWRSTSRQ